MSDPSPAITSPAQLAQWLADGCKPREHWHIGTEHEKFGFRTDDLRPLPHDGERSIRAVLEGLASRYEWQPVYEDGQLIALAHDDGASVTLEPAGQLELSGAQVKHIHDTCREVNTHLAQVKAVAEPLGIGFLGMGFLPKWTRQDMPWMPKSRYGIMRNYMPGKGGLGLDMMTRTCTVQVNLDFSSEADMVRKFRVALALQPVATALFANSPFTEGRPNGYMSYRSHIWTDTDPDRTGMLDFVFEDGFGFERYADWLLDVPMYFVERDGRSLNAAGQSFRDFLSGRLPALPGELPTIKDWADHATTVFPEVRLKRYLEMRGADAGPWNQLCALPAFWTGLLYDDAALDAAWDLVKDFSHEERHQLRDQVPRTALKTPFRQGTVNDLAKQVLAISADGLARRDIRNRHDADERIFLEPLLEFVAAGLCPAEVKLDLFQQRWQGDIDRLYRECAY